jgi:hypothetical protein
MERGAAGRDPGKHTPIADSAAGDGPGITETRAAQLGSQKPDRPERTLDGGQVLDQRHEGEVF